uniref:Uncharacterized protein n=1 Tax=Oryza brachyantha TaxID=4533 RepID=J3MRF0_ORYBR
MPLACPLLAAGCRPPSLASSVLAASPDACRSSRQTAQVPQRPGRTFIPLYTRKQVSTERYERYREKRAWRQSAHARRRSAAGRGGGRGDGGQAGGDDVRCHRGRVAAGVGLSHVGVACDDRRQRATKPDHFSLPFALNAATSLQLLPLGASLHALALLCPSSTRRSSRALEEQRRKER